MEVNKNKPYIGLWSTKTTFLSVSCVSLNSFGVSLGEKLSYNVSSIQKKVGNRSRIYFARALFFELWPE